MISLSVTQWHGKRSEAASAFDLSVMIRRLAAELFALVADIQDAEPLTRRAALRMEKDPSGPTAVGTRWHEAVQIAPGCWLHIESIASIVILVRFPEMEEVHSNDCRWIRSVAGRQDDSCRSD